ncbi:MAG: ABC transporter substrate-binding protein, partial [Candidatus Dormibacteraeota bacterium]|nr:ABC transporter substrate-binding protein [Candidatus Dormibacteraeota bacterium]
MRRSRRLLHPAGPAVLGALFAQLACNAPPAPAPSNAPLRIGAVYPTSTEPGALDQLHGLETAAALADESGGDRGRQIVIVAEDATHMTAVTAAVDGLVNEGVSVIFGTYDSDLALAASAEAAQDGATFMETGGLADTITRRGLAGVLRAGQSGSTLGAYAARFTRDVVIPGLHLSLGGARVVVIFEDDAYGASVADGAVSEAAAVGVHIVDTVKYAPVVSPAYYGTLAGEMAQDRPDVLIAGQFSQGAINLRQALAALHVQVGALIGASSTYSNAAYPQAVGAGAVGVFAADGPDQGMSTAGLLPSARQLLDRATSAYQARFHTTMSSSAIEGFVGGWIMFHNVMPGAASTTRADLMRAA